MSSLNDKRVLVTGADGFIPSYVCEALVKKGAKVTALVRRNSSNILKNIDHLKSEMEIIWGDIQDFSQMINITKNKEIIYHLAANSHVAYSINNPVESFQIQTEGMINILEASRINDVERIIHAGSAEEYGLVSDTLIKEDFPLLPRSPYAAGKVAADRLMYSYWASYNTPVVMSRFFGIYGPRQSAEKAIPKFILQALNKEKITIYGDGTQTRDFMHGVDAGEAYAELGIAKNIEGMVINIGTGLKYQIIDIAKQIVKQLGTNNDIFKDHNIKPGEATHLVADPTILKQTLKWEPKISWEDGLKETIEFYVKHETFYRKVISAV